MRYSNNLFGSLLAVVSLTLWLPAPALAQAPSRITFEGVVTDSTGSPVDGETDLTFSLYDAEVGGTTLHQETQTVNADNGYVRVQIGTAAWLDISLFTRYLDVYLGIAVGDESEQSPRLLLPVSPFAASAAYAGDAMTLQGYSASQLRLAATPPATNVSYSNTGTDLSASNSQEAINALLGRIQSLESDNDKLKTAVDDLQTQNEKLRSDLEAQIAALRSELQPKISSNTTAISDLDAVAQDHETRITLVEGQDLDARLSPLEDKTASISVSTIDGQPAVVFTGVNVAIQNGTGATDTTNGTGNLVIGYNSLRDDDTDARDGSHNLVLGDQNSHTSDAYASVLSGYYNDVQAGYTATIGGTKNTASGTGAVVVASASSEASGDNASVTGGIANIASGRSSSVTGGSSNVASAYSAAVAGGAGNTASGSQASVTGGSSNSAEGDRAAVTGGLDNHATVGNASVTGGASNTANGYAASVGGGWQNSASSHYSAVSGGYGNTARGQNASVTGGSNNTASGWYSSVSGGLSNTASAYYASVTGGKYNTASAYYASVSGGYQRQVTGSYDWRAGGYFQEQ